MTATVLLIRHAAHDRPGPHLVGRDDRVALSLQGRADAEHLATALAAAPLRRIVTSPARRCRETADIIARPHGLLPDLRDGWDELDFGAWRGAAFDTLAPDGQWHRFNAARGTAVIPGGETIHGVADRVIRALAEAEGVTAIVTHADVIRTALAIALGLSPDAMLRMEVAPASVSVVRLATPPVVDAINWQPTLPLLPPA